MTFEIGLVFGIIGVAMILFFTERLSIDTVSILVMVTFLITGILDIKEGLAGFSNYATITIGAMFVISAAILKTGLLDTFIQLMNRQAERGSFFLLLTIMLVSGLLSAFINDTAVVALLMPAVIQMGRKNEIPVSQLLMPLSFGALMGGVSTLLGTSTNILVSGIAEREGLPEFGVFEMTKGGIVFFAVGILYILTIGKWLIPKRKSASDLSDSTNLGNYLVEIMINEDFEQLDEPIFKQSIFKKLGIEILQIVRADGKKVRVYPNSSIQEGDLIRVTIEKNALEKIKKEKGISLKTELEWNQENLTDEDQKIIEAMVTPQSRLINRTLDSFNFRNLLPEMVVLGIRHRPGLMDTLVKKTRLNPGDILLLRSPKESVHSLDKKNDLLLLTENKVKNINKVQSMLTLFTLIAVIALAALNILPIVVSAVSGAVLVILFNSIDPKEAYEAIDWKVIFMLAGVLSMGAALEKTGGAEFLGNLITENLREYGPRAVLAGVFGLTFLLTNVMSNNATAAILAPIAISIADNIGVESRPFLMAVTFAASLSFMTPMGYQTNTMIYNPGNYKFKDYLIVGSPLNIIFWVLAIWLIPLLYPF
ncbi:SLC13 family permease [Algoriphagus sp.]|uniref:SLC13 family permease n=1 Tax=Algoriphagus sp. TaxID=1872435 RepID=UPI0026388FFD|nr:SLC13 family permease [Algoriphagus sp.]